MADVYGDPDCGNRTYTPYSLSRSISYKKPDASATATLLPPKHNSSVNPQSGSQTAPLPIHPTKNINQQPKPTEIVAPKLSESYQSHDSGIGMSPKSQLPPKHSGEDTSGPFDTDQEYARARLLEEPQVLEDIGHDFVDRLRAFGEENAVFKVSHEDFYKWESKELPLAQEDGNYYEYDATKSELIIKAANGPIHEMIIDEVMMWLREPVSETAKQKLKFCPGPTVNFTDGSKKQSDYAVFPNHPRNQRKFGFPSVVIEVAFAETSEKLGKDIYRWLTETNGCTKLVIAVELHEVRKKPLKEEISIADNSYWVEHTQTKESLQSFERDVDRLADLLIDRHNKKTLLLKNGPLVGDITGTLSTHRRNADGKVEESWKKMFYSSKHPVDLQESEEWDIITTADLLDEKALVGEAEIKYRAPLIRLRDQMPDLIEYQLDWRAELKAEKILKGLGLSTKKRRRESESEDESNKRVKGSDSFGSTNSSSGGSNYIPADEKKPSRESNERKSKTVHSRRLQTTSSG